MIWLNGRKLNFETFPNGETRVDGRQLHDIVRVGRGSNNRIRFKYENDGDLIRLMFVKKFLNDRNTNAELKILYMPYSRMDRVEGNSIFTLKYVCDFINRLFFLNVEVVEPHSDVTCALLDRSIATYSTINLLNEIAYSINFNKEKDILFFPDAGAQKRYSKVTGYQQLVGYKKRDFETGKITELQVVGEVPKDEFKVIICDDLCSYGGTFLLSAERLRELGATEIYLLVAHIEDSIHEGKLLDATWNEKPLIDKIYTTDSILTKSHRKIIALRM